jgi:hypothetical protein
MRAVRFVHRLLCPLDPDCNWRKGPSLTGIDPDTGELVRLFHPRHDRWFDDFTGEEQYVSGITSAGRTTVSLLEMNVSNVDASANSSRRFRHSHMLGSTRL